MALKIRSGSVIGREHVRLWKNNQDGVRIGTITMENVTYYYGIICDGCSSGENNEVGANLLAQYLCSEIQMSLLVGTNIRDIPSALYPRAIGYLRSIASLTSVGDPCQNISFITNHLLCTVMGFISDEKTAIIFHAGDGAYVIGNSATWIDQDNRPMYLAYHLVDRKFLDLQGGELPQGFETVSIDLSFDKRFAVCSDGITDKAVPFLWGHDHELGLQRKLKVLSRKDIPFVDDCSAIAVEVIDEEIKLPEEQK